MSPKRLAADHLRHALGWRTQEKLILFNVDDYGSIRLASKKARQALRKAIPGFGGAMDERDALETREDLEVLLEVLSRHRGADGRSAVFTAYALCANPDLEWMRTQREYRHEWLPQTFERLAAEQPSAYTGTWELWQEGMREGLIHPQCHGREHMNVSLLEAKLARGDADLEANLTHGCMAGLAPLDAMPGVGFTQSFNLHDRSELERHRSILADAFDGFEQVYGFRSRSFTPPAQKLHRALEAYVHERGVAAIDKPFYGRQPTGRATDRRVVNFLRRPSRSGPGSIVRNVVFEPTNSTGSDPVGRALSQIEIAFRWHKPAIISSHRVNYSGHIEQKNRKVGIDALDKLLSFLIKKYPDARFMAIDSLIEAMC